MYEVDTNFYQTLLSEGWVIASTSYQTNDWVVSDGGVDILALKNFVDGEITAVKRAVVYGETMGGGVAVWLAENEPEAFAGVFALGAHLYPEPRQGAEPVTELATVFNAAPKLPIIFVANVEEMQSSLTYVDAVGDGGSVFARHLGGRSTRSCECEQCRTPKCDESAAQLDRG